MEGDDYLPFSDGTLWGFRDASGQELIAPQFESAGSFSEGLARVRQGGKWGFIDTKGEWSIPPRFEQARVFTGGVAKVKEGGTWVLIDREGFAFEQVEGHTFLDDRGRFISEREYKDWEKPLKGPSEEEA